MSCCSIYILKKQRRQQVFDGSSFVVPAFSLYIGYANDLRSALSMANGVRSTLQVPVFIGAFFGERPTLEQRP